MNDCLIENNNQLVKDKDTVIHGGDFSLGSVPATIDVLKRLKGKHILLKGSHDRPITRIIKKENYKDLFEYGGEIYELNIGNIHIVICHYAMRTWPRSHYNSWQLYGHSHGKLGPIGKQWDIGIDNNDYKPIFFDQLKEIMDDRPDNEGYLRITEKKLKERGI